MCTDPAPHTTTNTQETHTADVTGVSVLLLISFTLSTTAASNVARVTTDV